MPRAVGYGKPKEETDAWPQWAIDLSISVWEAGKSAGTIRQKLASGDDRKHPSLFKSRSAVIGKIKRMGLTRNKDPGSVWVTVNTRVRRIRPTGAKPDEKTVVHNPNVASFGIQRGERTPAAVPTIVEFDPNNAGVPVQQAEGRCMWPMNESVRDMLVCGATITCGAYCDHHASKAYRTMPTRKRQATFAKVQEIDKDEKYSPVNDPLLETVDEPKLLGYLKEPTDADEPVYVMPTPDSIIHGRTAHMIVQDEIHGHDS